MPRCFTLNSCRLHHAHASMSSASPSPSLHQRQVAVRPFEAQAEPDGQEPEPRVWFSWEPLSAHVDKQLCHIHTKRSIMQELVVLHTRGSIERQKVARLNDAAIQVDVIH